ncbi:MAG: PEP-CTERM sorting domain-containing protein [Pseudomonadota bacterium]
MPTKKLGLIAAAALALPVTATASLIEITATNINGEFSDFNIVYQDSNADGLLQYSEILEFSGFTRVSSGWTWEEIVGVPDIAGISSASGYSNDNDVYWWVTPSWYNHRPNAWYGTRWSYTTTGGPGNPVAVPEPGTLGLMGMALTAFAFTRRRRQS